MEFSPDPEPDYFTVITIRVEVIQAPAAYRLVAYSVPAQTVQADVQSSDSLDANEPFQVYDLKENPGDTFTFEAEETQADGKYLWVNHVFTGPSSAPPPRADFPEDQSWQDIAKTGLLRVWLFYTDDKQYRAVVHAIGPYRVTYSRVQVHDLGTDSPAIYSDTVSHQKPISVATFEGSAGERVLAQLQVSGVTVHSFQDGKQLLTTRDNIAFIPNAGPVYLVTNYLSGNDRGEITFFLKLQRGLGAVVPPN